jgi:hypothetical protein
MNLKIDVKVNEMKTELIKQALIKSCLIVQADAKMLCPVDTGRLKGSITMATNDYQTNVESPAEATDAVDKPDKKLYGRIGSNVNYAADVEYKNGGIYAFLRRSLIKNTGKIKNIFAEALRMSMRG